MEHHLRRLVHGVRESLPWKREEIDGERSIARETKEIDS
jgi:hypothetical protein